MQEQSFNKYCHGLKGIPVNLTMVNPNADRSLSFYSIDADGKKTLKNACRYMPFQYVDRLKFCNGLVLVNSIVFNPTTGERMDLPTPTSTIPLAYEFGFDTQTKKYKVLAWDISNLDERRFMVHTLGTVSWRRTVSTRIRFGEHRIRSFCMKGKFHWTSCEDKILSFDLNSEKIEIINGPERANYFNFKHESSVAHLFEFEGCICLADHHSKTASPTRIIDLWMQEDSNQSVWIKMSKIVLSSKRIYPEIPHFTRTGEILIAKSSGGRKDFYVYNLFTKQVTKIRIRGLTLGFLVPDYVENSVRLEE